MHFGVFWLGIGIALLPAVLVGTYLPTERSALCLTLVLFAMTTYVPKVLLSPDQPAYFDEFAHLRQLQDLLSTGSFGSRNDLLPVIQYYPVLSMATAAVHYLTMLDAWHAGIVLIAVARCATVLLIFALARKVGQGWRASFFAALIYAGNPGFMFFDSQYAYESLAIPLVLGTAVCCASAKAAETRRQLRRSVMGGLVLSTLATLTHHISSLVMAALCVLLVTLLPVVHDDHLWSTFRRARQRGALMLAAEVLLASVVWNFLINRRTEGYLSPSLAEGFGQLIGRIRGSVPKSATNGDILNNTAPTHTPFAGSGVPVYEVFLAYLVPVSVLGGALWTVLRIWRAANRWSELRSASPFAVFAVGYLSSLPLTLTASGGQAAHRSWPFFFIGVSIFLVWTPPRRPAARTTRAAPPGTRDDDSAAERQAAPGRRAAAADRAAGSVRRGVAGVVADRDPHCRASPASADEPGCARGRAGAAPRRRLGRPRRRAAVQRRRRGVRAAGRGAAASARHPVQSPHPRRPGDAAPVPARASPRPRAVSPATRRSRLALALIEVLALLALNIGNVSAGVNVAYRFPGRYEFGVDNRFQTKELARLVDWADRHLEPHAKVITDRFTSQPLLVGSTLHVPTNAESYAFHLYLTPQSPSRGFRLYLRAHDFRYFILDTRIEELLPTQAFFQTYTGPQWVNIPALRSIRNNNFIQLLYSTRHYKIFHIRP